MKIHGSHRLPVGRERAYALLQNPEILAACMPGCEALVKVDEDLYEMKMKMALAAISGQFAGKVRIGDRNPVESFRLIVEGTGKIGFMKGEGLLRLREEGAETEVAYEGDVHVGGTIASVGQRLLDTTSKMLIKRFFDKLNERAQKG
ncbi:MAG: carbon monoxide dehydrogenase subunit G [Bryobacterales bacterium]|nr:carbon monoxide dehydrogenase subunit G [Bryobacterales bacterium]